MCQVESRNYLVWNPISELPAAHSWSQVLCPESIFTNCKNTVSWLEARDIASTPFDNSRAFAPECFTACETTSHEAILQVG